MCSPGSREAFTLDTQDASGTWLFRRRRTCSLQRDRMPRSGSGTAKALANSVNLTVARDGIAGFADSGRTVLVLEAGNPSSLGRWDARSGELLGRVPIDLIGTFHYSQFTNDGQALLAINKHGDVNEWDAKVRGAGDAPLLMRPASFTF